MTDVMTRPAARRWTLAGRGSGRWLMGGLIVVLGLLVVAPVGMLVVGSFRDSPRPGTGGSVTLDNYVETYGDPHSLTLLYDTLSFTAGALVVSLVVGTLLALLIVRTDVPLKGLWATAIIAPLIFPPFLKAIAFILLLSPRIGVANEFLKDLLGLESAPFNIFSMGGMVFVRSLGLVPIVYLAMSAVFATMDGSFEEAARTSGAKAMRTLMRITLPLARPAMLSVAVLLFVYGIESFETPLILGGPAGIDTFSSEIYYAIFRGFPANYGYATALATVLVLMSVAALWLQRRATRRSYRYATIVGQSHRPRVIALGRWRYPAAALVAAYAFISFVLPLAVLLLGSVMPYFSLSSLKDLDAMSLDAYGDVLDHPVSGRAFRNTVFLAAVGTTIAMVIVMLGGFITHKTRLKGRSVIEYLTLLPLAVPGSALAVGLIWTYVFVPLPIYGTIWILLIAFVIIHIPAGSRLSVGAIHQVSRDMVDGAAVCGAGHLGRFSRIVLPLARSGFVAGWVYGFIFLFREFNVAVFLFGSGTEVVATMIYSHWENGYVARTCALAVILIAVMSLVVAVLQRLLRIKVLRSG